MLTPKRKFIALGVLVVGIVVSLSIATMEKNTEGAEIGTSSKTSTERFLAFPSEPTTKSVQQNPQPEYNSPGLPDLGETNNLTELLARRYAVNILTEGEQALDTNALIKTLQDQSSEKLLPSYLTKEDILVSSDDSLRAQIAYITEIKSFLWADGGNSSLVGTFSLFIGQEAPDGVAGQITEELTSQFNKILKISAPPSWRVFHLDLVNLWQEKIVVFQSLSELQSDPLKAYIGLQQLSLIIQRDSDSWAMLSDVYEELALAE